MNDTNRIQNSPSPGNMPARPQVAPSGPRQADAPSFADTFSQAQVLQKQAQVLQKQVQQTQGIQFSNHAQKRLQTRDIQMNEGCVNRLADAVDKAEKRGGKSSLVLVDDLAFIVNVRERMVVTAMDSKERGEGVFSQIDSVVFAAPAEEQATPADKQGPPAEEQNRIE